MASRRIEDLHPDLVKVYQLAKARYLAAHPEKPAPVLTATYRSPVEQNSLYNQPWDKKDNDGDGKVDERDEKVTNAKAYQSAHNYLPARAFDVAFVLGKRTYWDMVYFDLFAKYVTSAAKELGIGISQGIYWKSFKDAPHTELLNWKKVK